MTEFGYRYELDLNAISDEYAKKLSGIVDEMTLDKAWRTLEKYGYVKVVRCRDCNDYRESDATCHSWQWHNWDAALEVEPNGFCAWGERRDAE